MPGSTKGGIAVRGELLHRLIGASVLHSEDGGPQAMHRSAAQARSGVDEAPALHTSAPRCRTCRDTVTLIAGRVA